MGCPAEVIIGDNLVFSVTTHDPDTGVLTDAAAVPSYRIYEDETAAPILTGNMAKLDDDNTTGFYTELIACTVANGFEAGKTYTVYIEATVDSDKGGICYGFKAVNSAEVAGGYLANLYQSIVTLIAQCADVPPVAGTTIHLNEGASAVNDYYKGQVIVLCGGTGAGQARACTGYDGLTKVATVGPAWATNPNATTWFSIVNWGSSVVSSIDAGVINAASIANGAIDAATFAADVDAEIAAMVWTAHTPVVGIDAGLSLDRIYEILNNHMHVVEATGVVTLYAADDATPLATGAVNSAAGTTDRDQLSWA